MMNEIKYRGKRTDNGEWVYGWYAEDNGRPIIITSLEIYSTTDGDVPYLEYQEVIRESVELFNNKKREKI